MEVTMGRAMSRSWGEWCQPFAIPLDSP